MHILQVEIANFRGIKKANWVLNGTCLCLVGPNDSGKTTLLDAIEFALSPAPYLNLSEVDYYNTKTDEPIDIKVTVGGIPLDSPLWLDNKYGLLKRGWKRGVGVIDEPEDEDNEPVLTFHLRADNSYEPEWTVFAEREPKDLPISPRNRALLGVVRLGSDVERDLAWGRYSVLSKLTEGKEVTGIVMAEAQRQLREAAKEGKMEALNEAARRVEQAARQLGVHPSYGYRPGLDPKLVTFRQGAFALHDGDIPVRAAGLGTRRLTALAIQRTAVPDGAIVLIDEVEHGLEPYRIRRLLRNLRQGLEPAPADSAEPRLGQVIMTTHSAIPLFELDYKHIRVVRSRVGETEVRRPIKETQGVLRRVPAAFLARKVLLCEGATEVGFCRRLAEHWMKVRNGVPVEHFGVEVSDASGSNARISAIAMADLKYEVAYLGDSDRAKPAEVCSMQAKGVKTILWQKRLCTEEVLAHDLPEKGFEELLGLACNTRGSDRVAAVLSAILKVEKPADPSKLEAWPALGVEMADLRDAFGKGAKGVRGDGKRKGWFKSVEGGYALGAIVVKHLDSMNDSGLRANLEEAENWCYDGGTS